MFMIAVTRYKFRTMRMHVFYLLNRQKVSQKSEMAESSESESLISS